MQDGPKKRPTLEPDPDASRVVKRIFDMAEARTGMLHIARALNDEGIASPAGKLWSKNGIHFILRNEVYTGTLIWGASAKDKAEPVRIEKAFPAIISKAKSQRVNRLMRSRAPKVINPRRVGSSHLLSGLINVRNGKKYSYDLPTPRRYYKCNGMQSMRLRCREKPYIPAEQLEETIWSEVKRVIQNPHLIVAGIDILDSQEGGGLQADIAQAERDLRNIQMEEDRAVRLFVSGKITEAQLDLQRKFITERLESARAKLDDYRVQEASGAEKRRLMKYVLAWAKKVGKGVDKLTDEERKGILQTIVEEVVIDRQPPLLAQIDPLPMIDEGPGRVLRRVLGLLDAGPAYSDIRLAAVAERILPDSHAREFNLGLIDIGAAYCHPRTPGCPECPLLDDCIVGSRKVGVLRPRV